MLYGNVIFIKKTGLDGSKFPVTEKSIKIGRGEECGIRIVNPHVSHRQCELIVEDNGQAKLRNLCSTNPTIVNGKPLSGTLDHVLQHGDILQIGERLARWEYLSSSALYTSHPSQSAGSKLVAVVTPQPAMVLSAVRASDNRSSAQDVWKTNIAELDDSPIEKQRRSSGILPGRHSTPSRRSLLMNQAESGSSSSTVKPPTSRTPSQSGSKHEYVLKRKLTPMKPSTPTPRKLSPVQKLVMSAVGKGSSKAPSLNTILETSPIRQRSPRRSLLEKSVSNTSRRSRKGNEDKRRSCIESPVYATPRQSLDSIQSSSPGASPGGYMTPPSTQLTQVENNIFIESIIKSKTRRSLSAASTSLTKGRYSFNKSGRWTVSESNTSESLTRLKGNKRRTQGDLNTVVVTATAQSLRQGTPIKVQGTQITSSKAKTPKITSSNTKTPEMGKMLNVTSPKAQTPKVISSRVKTPKVTSASGKTPNVTSPRAKTPKATSPRAKTPKVTSPKAKTPEVTSPRGKTLKMTSPRVKTPNVTSPRVKTPNVTSPRGKTPQVTSPRGKTSEVTSRRVRTPEVTSPRVKTPEVTSPRAKTPKVTSPRVKTPTVTSQSGKTSEVTSRRVKTPEVTSPRVKTPIVTSPRGKTPIVTSPRLKTPKVTSPRVKTPKVTSPRVKTPEVTSPRVKTPIVTSPRGKTPIVTSPRAKTPKVTSPRTKTPKLTTPMAKSPNLTPKTILQVLSPKVKSPRDRSQAQGSKRKMSGSTLTTERPAKRLKITAPTVVDKNKKAALLVLSKATRQGNQPMRLFAKTQALVKKAVKQSNKRARAQAKEMKTFVSKKQQQTNQQIMEQASFPKETSPKKATRSGSKSPVKSEAVAGGSSSPGENAMQQRSPIDINSIVRGLPSPTQMGSSRRSSKRISSKNDSGRPDYYELSPTALGLTPCNTQVLEPRRRSCSLSTPKMKQGTGIIKSASTSKAAKRKSVSFIKNDMTMFDFDAVQTPNISTHLFVSPLLKSGKTSPASSLSEDANVKLARKKRGKHLTVKTKQSPGLSSKKLIGVKKLFAKSPENDLTNVSGIKKLFRAPATSPRNEITNLGGVERFFKSPKRSSNVGININILENVRRLFHESPTNDLTDVRGVRRLLKGTPPSPKNDLTDVRGLRSLFQGHKSPSNDLRNVVGLKNLFQSPSTPLVEPAGTDVASASFSPKLSNKTSRTRKLRNTEADVTPPAAGRRAPRRAAGAAAIVLQALFAPTRSAGKAPKVQITNEDVKEEKELQPAKRKRGGQQPDEESAMVTTAVASTQRRRKETLQTSPASPIVQPRQRRKLDKTPGKDGVKEVTRSRRNDTSKSKKESNKSVTGLSKTTKEKPVGDNSAVAETGRKTRRAVSKTTEKAVERPSAGSPKAVARQPRALRSTAQRKTTTK